MNPRVQELFHEVADLSPEERTRYFREHDVDQAACDEVEALLAFDSGASAFLLRDISIAASRALPLLEAKGWRCGPYRLLNVIGRGGMGAVYLAERADGEVTQRVAVKLLPPGAGDSHRERFLQERQILANLTHPNIARMLDAGHLDTGQPFLAMEYIDGKPIDVFAAGLGVRQKIGLFLKVCAAVAYLHRNLVVHRDLKPSNILVTGPASGRPGEPKLLDFGIAKILDLGTDLTMPSMRMLTPDYASPEQVTGGRLTTATDIYSLGAVLYHLLTGKPAHEFADSSPENITVAITRREVTRPSKWAPELRGDLEAILLKALRKDPQERYANVEQLAEDLEAFLESRPVCARAGNTLYYVRKFLRRYRVPVAAAALLAGSIATGLYIANHQRAIAQRRFLQVRQVANRFVAFDGEIRGLHGVTNLRNRIVSTALTYLAGVGKQVRGDEELSLEIGAAYLQVARIQGVPSDAHLGRFAEAAESLRRADTFVEAALAADAGNRRALLTSAQIARDRIILAIREGHYEEVLAYAGRISAQLARFRSRGRLEPGEAAEADSLLRAVQFAGNYRGAASRGPESTQGRLGTVSEAWGSNQYGQLGTGTTTDTNVPARSSILTGVIGLAAGWRHNVALRSDGTVWTWGDNSHGQLGLGSHDGQNVPMRVSSLADVVAASAGYSYSLAVRADGSVWAWGSNSLGQLGRRGNTDSTLPVRVSGLSKVKAVSAGGAHAVALRSDGTVWTWGRNNHGQLGIGNDSDQNVPRQVSGLKDVVAVAAGYLHNLAIRSDGSLWAWGANFEGELGTGVNHTDSNVPVPVPGLTHVAAVGAGDETSLALKADGTVWAWGAADFDPEAGSDVPVQVAGLSRIAAISIATGKGWGHDLAVRNDGTVWAWGYNSNGQLGNGASTNCRLPVLVPGVYGIFGVAAGGLHSLVLSSRGGGLVTR